MLLHVCVPPMIHTETMCLPVKIKLGQLCRTWAHLKVAKKVYRPIYLVPVSIAATMPLKQVINCVC